MRCASIGVLIAMVCWGCGTDEGKTQADTFTPVSDAVADLGAADAVAPADVAPDLALGETVGTADTATETTDPIPDADGADIVEMDVPDEPQCNWLRIR